MSGSQFHTSTGAQTGANIVGATYNPDGPGPRLMLADTIDGNDVCNTFGEKLGHLKGIMLDVEHGRIAYAVLSVGGVLGMGDKLFAIPWSALTLDTENKEFVLDANKDKLKNAPGFDKDHWPSMADPNWAKSIHSYYGVRHYWE